MSITIYLYSFSSKITFLFFLNLHLSCDFRKFFTSDPSSIKITGLFSNMASNSGSLIPRFLNCFYNIRITLSISGGGFYSLKSSILKGSICCGIISSSIMLSIFTNEFSNQDTSYVFNPSESICILL